MELIKGLDLLEIESVNACALISAYIAYTMYIPMAVLFVFTGAFPLMFIVCIRCGIYGK